MKGSITMENNFKKKKMKLLKTMLFVLSFSCLPQSVSAKESQCGLEQEVNELKFTIQNLFNKIMSAINSKENKDKKLVALTFDDGPGKYTEEILELLEENNASATFFLVGEEIERRPENAIAIHESGNEIGIHGYTHSSFTKLGATQTIKEIEQVNDLLESLGIDRTTLVRPPYGSLNQSIRELDYTYCLWNLDTLDWKTKDKDKIKQAIRDDIDENSIILVHEIHKPTLEALQEILPELVEEGYEFVTFTELFEQKEITLETQKTYRTIPEQESFSLLIIPPIFIKKKHNKTKNLVS